MWAAPAPKRLGSRLPGARRRRAGRRRRSAGQTRGQQERRGSLKEFHPARFLGLGNPSKDPSLKPWTFQTALQTRSNSAHALK